MSKFNKNKFVGAGAGLLSEISSQQSTGRSDDMVIFYRSWSELVPHEENKFSQEELMERVDSIRTAGRLLQPISYLDIQLPDGTYKIISGHTRHEALRILGEEDPKWLENIPCTPITTATITLPISEESKEKLLIRLANDYRTKTDADRLMEYRENKEMYMELKRNGYKLSDKMRNLLADDLKVSSAQVGKIDYIEKHAVPEVIKALENNHMSITEADQVAHMKEEDQKEVASHFMNPPVQDNANSGAKGENVPDQINNGQAPNVKDILKDKKPKLIDSLTEDSYTIKDSELQDVIEQISPLSEKTQNDIIVLDRKGYAKYLTAKEKISHELEKIKVLFDNA